MSSAWKGTGCSCNRGASHEAARVEVAGPDERVAEKCVLQGVEKSRGHRKQEAVPKIPLSHMREVHLVNAFPYRYAWNRMGRKGQRCAVLVRGAMNSCLVEFEDGFRAVTSRNALRRAK